MTPEEQANDIVTRGFDLPPNQLARLRNLIRDSIAAAITDAIAAEREKWIAAGFADEKGEPRKVLGTLPMTADGAYVGDGGNCFFPWRYGNRVVMMKKVRHCGLVCQEGDCVASIEECYSTREAAELARLDGKEKPTMLEHTATVGADEPCYPPRLRLNTIDGEPIVVGGTYFDANGHRFTVSAIYLDQTPHGDVVIGVRSEEGRCCWWNLYAAESARAEAGKEKPANKAVPRQSMIKIGGESFRCSCKCNVFTVIEETADTMRYRCNGCSETYTGEKKQ